MQITHTGCRKEKWTWNICITKVYISILFLNQFITWRFYSLNNVKSWRNGCCFNTSGIYSAWEVGIKSIPTIKYSGAYLVPGTETISTLIDRTEAGKYR